MRKKRKTFIKSYPLTPLRFVAEKQSGYERFFNFFWFLIALAAFVFVGVPILWHLATWVWPTFAFKDASSPLWLAKIIPHHPFEHLTFTDKKAFLDHEYWNIAWAAIPGALFSLTFWFLMKAVSQRSAGISIVRFVGFVTYGALAFAALYFFFFLFEEQKSDYWKISHELEKTNEKVINIVGRYALKALGWIITLCGFILPFLVCIYQSLIFIIFKQFTMDYRYQPIKTKIKKTPQVHSENAMFEHYRLLLNLPTLFNRETLDKHYDALLNYYFNTSDELTFVVRKKEVDDYYRFLRPYCYENQVFKQDTKHEDEGLLNNGQEMAENH